MEQHEEVILAMKKRIVLIGGGYTSLFAYRNLVKSRKIRKMIAGETLEIVLISDRERHYFHGFTGEVITGVFSYDAICTPLTDLFPLATIIKGTVTQVSPFLQSVYYQQDQLTHECAYDELVMGTGTVDRVLHDAVPAYTHAIKKPNGLQDMLDNLNSYLHKLDTFQVGKGTIAVIGGGFTGVEIAANIHTFLEKEKKRHRVNLQLITKGETLLPLWARQHPVLYGYTCRQLKKMHIDVLLNTRIGESVDSPFTSDHGKATDHPFIINASGQQKVAITGLHYLMADNGSRYVGNKYLQSEKAENIWVGGDSSLIAKPFSTSYCPQNALWAIMHGKKIGNNLRRKLLMKKLAPFRFPGLGLAANLGGMRGAMELYGIPFTGPVASILRMGFFLYFFPHKRRLYRMYWDDRTTGPIEQTPVLQPGLTELQENKPLKNEG